MNRQGAGPLSRPFPLHRVVPAGVDALVEASEAECAALAADLDLPAVHRLEGRFRLAGTRERVAVTGRVTARIEQLCGVTLEPFPVSIDEAVDLTFAPVDPRAARDPATEVELSMDHDPPEEIAGDALDLGAVTAEFLALALDPFPRKPGITFEPPEGEPVRDSPFARLAALKPKADER